MAAGLVRITLIQTRPINAFVTSGNRMFIRTGLIQQLDGVEELAPETGQIAGDPICRNPAAPPLADLALAEEVRPPGPQKLGARNMRNAAQRDKLTEQQREQDDAMRRRYPR